MTEEAKALQDALREARTKPQMEAALNAASAYVVSHRDEDLEPLTATMHVVQMTVASN